MRDAGLDAHRVDLAGELRLRHRLRVAVAAADALAPCDGASSRPTARRRALRRRHGGEHHPRQVAAGDRDRGLARVQVRRHGGAGRPAAQAWAWRGAQIGIEMDYLPAGDFAAAARSCCRRRTSRRRRPCWRGCAQIKTPEEIERPAPAVAHRRQGDHRRVSRRCMPGASEMDLGGGAHARHLRAGRRVFQADDRRDRRAQRVSECRPDRARAQARRRLPRRDFPDDRRLPCRRLPHRRGRRRPAACRAHLGATSSTCKYLLLDAIKPGASQPRDLRCSSSRRSASSTCRRSPSSVTASACTCTKTRISARPDDRDARSRHGARHRAADLRDRLRLRHAEQGHGAGHARAAASSCPTMLDTDKLIMIH